MAKVIKTIFNHVDFMREIYFDKVRLDEAYMDGVIVYKRMLEFDLPQQHKTFDLRPIIDKMNKYGATVIKVTNKLKQPSMHTGSFSGLQVIFVNEGELLGTTPGESALTLTSTMKLINNGHIRGAGGNGGRGGRGGSGRGGSGSANKTVSYVTAGKSWPATNMYWHYGRHGNRTVSQNGWTARSSGGNLYLTGWPC